MLALAVALKARGHTVGFVAPDNFVPWILAHGFQAEPDGIDIAQMIVTLGAGLDSARVMMRYLADVLIPRLFASVALAMPDADLIVGAGVQMAAPSVAESRDVPFATVAYCPCAVPSGASPPPVFRNQALPRWMNRLLWDVSGPLAGWTLLGPMNAGRAALGLRPIDSLFAHLIGDGVLVAADPDLAPLGDDAPPTTEAVGALVLEDTSRLDPRVEAFLRPDHAPIYVGFGSMIPKRSADLVSATIDAARALGRNVIIAGGWAMLDHHITAADDVLAVSEVPHAAVFPRVAAVVHHGGAGTTTAAARAGVPQIVLPHILDQFYWARRVEALGLGPRSLPVDLVTADILTARFDTALSDELINTKTAALGRAIGARNGASAAVDYLERLALHSRP